LSRFFSYRDQPFTGGSMATAGIRALAATLPDDVRTNDYWRQRYPEIVAAEQRWQHKKERAKTQEHDLVEPGKLTDSLLFDATMAPYFLKVYRMTDCHYL
jgi:hypothetical protein